MPGPNRANFEPDYGRRGKLWVHGGFEPAIGQAVILTSLGRDSASHVQLLEKIMVAFPADRWLINEDNLSIHVSRSVKLALATWPKMQLQFIPKYACWLNLIEPWWKQLRSLALKGHRFETLDELTQVLNEGVDYWNKRRQTDRRQQLVAAAILEQKPARPGSERLAAKGCIDAQHDDPRHERLLAEGSGGLHPVHTCIPTSTKATAGPSRTASAIAAFLWVVVAMTSMSPAGWSKRTRARPTWGSLSTIRTRMGLLLRGFNRLHLETVCLPTLKPGRSQTSDENSAAQAR